MRKFFVTTLFACCLGLTGVNAQTPTEGTEYYLPKTELHFRLLVEKSSYTPGEYAMYSERFMKKTAPDSKSVSYNIVGVSMYAAAIPDSTKQYVLPIDKKHSIFSVERSANGILQAVNAKGKTPSVPEPFKAAPKKAIPNPHDYMSGDILAAGSTAKMAELTANEIYDIRDSRNELSRGDADYMPKDGEQLKIMLGNLSTQVQILLQTFQGVTVKDTMEVEVTFCPTKEMEGKQLLCRFSKGLGLVDDDDLGGAPYYIEVEDLKVIPELETSAPNEKRSKDDPGIIVNMPGKIKVTLMEGNQPMKVFELYAAQYGRLESLSSNLFGKKFTTHLQLNPVTGNVESMEVEPLD